MNSPLAYIGGKSKLANTIIDMMPEHKAYCEVFAGAAWVFFKKPISKYEVINDLDSDLVSFYRVLQNHLEEFLRQFKWLLSSGSGSKTGNDSRLPAGSPIFSGPPDIIMCNGFVLGDGSKAGYMARHPCTTLASTCCE